MATKAKFERGGKTDLGVEHIAEIARKGGSYDVGQSPEMGARGQGGGGVMSRAVHGLHHEGAMELLEAHANALQEQRDELAALLDDAACLMATETNRMGKPEFYDEAARAARERIRVRAVAFGVTKADTVLHQAAFVIRAALAQVAK
jgi:hypothetical protein